MAIKKAVLFGIISGVFLGFAAALFGLSLSSPPPPSQIVADFRLTPTQIINSLPDRHLIETSFVPQAPEKNWEQPWQDACEEASLLTVKYYYLSSALGIKEILADYQQIFDYESSRRWSHDINLSQMGETAAGLFDLEAKIVSNPDIQTIKEYLVKDIPVIVTANGKTLYRENKHFKSGGPWYHSLVILGFDDLQKQFIVHDVGTQFGAYFRYSYQLLLDSIHDWPATGQKQDINTGQKAVLVLLK